MKKIALILVLISLWGCATVYRTIGIASTQYVEEQIVDINEVMEKDRAREIAKMKEFNQELQQLKADMERILEISEGMEQTRDELEELKQLASQVERRINNLSKETLLRLRDLLTSELDD